MDPHRIALLIDADNVPQDNVSRAISSLASLGDVSIRRAYGNWFDSRLKRWEPLLRTQSIRPVQQFGYTRGKNATDMALVIDAVSLMHTYQPDAFAIVSSDDADRAMAYLTGRGVEAWQVGEVIDGTGEVQMMGQYTRG